MEKLTVSVLLFLSLVFLGVQSSFADSIDTEGDLAFIVGGVEGPLVVKNISTGEVNQCIAAPYLDPLGNDVTDLLATATEVEIADLNAVVTVETTNENGTFNDIVVVDASACFGPDNDMPGGGPSECYSTVDLDSGLLVIPCVEVNGEVVTIHMQQRGNSSNWEVSFLGANPDFVDDGEIDEGEGDDSTP